MIEIGDLIIIKQTGYLASSGIKKNKITGIVVGTTIETSGGADIEEDYWIRVVFMDGTKSTLFHDEVNILSGHPRT